jgi:hypothetical protein
MFAVCALTNGGTDGPGKKKKKNIRENPSLFYLNQIFHMAQGLKGGKHLL